MDIGHDLFHFYSSGSVKIPKGVLYLEQVLILECALEIFLTEWPAKDLSPIQIIN